MTLVMATMVTMTMMVTMMVTMIMSTFPFSGVLTAVTLIAFEFDPLCDLMMTPTTPMMTPTLPSKHSMRYFATINTRPRPLGMMTVIAMNTHSCCYR